MKYFKDGSYYAAREDGKNTVYEFSVDEQVSCLWSGYASEVADFVLEGSKEISADEYLTALDGALQRNI